MQHTTSSRSVPSAEMTSLGSLMRAARVSFVAGAAALLVACDTNPIGTPTTPPASASAPTATPDASPRSSASPSPSAIASAEATSWTEVFEIDRASLGNLIAGPDGLIAAGCVATAEADCGRHIVVASPDAVDWQQLDVDASADISFASLRRVGDRLFALGYGHYGSDGGAMVWTSVDGRSWSRIESSSFRRRAVNDIIDSPSGALVIGYNAPIDSDNTSGFVLWPVRPDGSFGTARVVHTAGGPALVIGAVWTGTEFLAWGLRDGPTSGGPTILLASPDGKGWSFRAEISAVKRGAVEQIVRKGSRLVGVGYEGRRFPLSPRAWTSKDGGRSWKLADVPSGDAAMYTVGVEGSVLIARGRASSSGSDQRPASWSSTDGTAWIRLPEDVAMPALPGFSALTTATLGERTCVAGTFTDVRPFRAAIYCRLT